MQEASQLDGRKLVAAISPEDATSFVRFVSRAGRPVEKKMKYCSIISSIKYVHETRIVITSPYMAHSLQSSTSILGMRASSSRRAPVLTLSRAYVRSPFVDSSFFSLPSSPLITTPEKKLEHKRGLAIHA